MMHIAIIGGGAAGFFSAIHAKENYPNAQVTIYEKSAKVLAKVKVSGGGRCNVTNGCTSISTLVEAYPRGGKFLKKLFPQFHTKHTMEWFERRGVRLVIQADNCVFPASQDSQSIIDCFLSECNRLKILIQPNSGVSKIEPLLSQKIKLYFVDNEKDIVVDKVIVSTGGSPKRSGLAWLEALGQPLEESVPSLFTFNMPSEPIKQLMGVVVENARVSIRGTKLLGDGPLLITHWGMSGPAILKLSAFGARILSEKNYEFVAQVNWTNEPNQEKVIHYLKTIVNEHPQKQLSSFKPYALPERLWLFLLEKIQLLPQKRWIDLGNKGLNKLLNVLVNDEYAVKGKTTFKEEFVTCGGVSLEGVNPKTLESKVIKNLYFAGEVLDIDGITGGYNFQAAWTTAFVAAQLRSDE